MFCLCGSAATALSCSLYLAVSVVCRALQCWEIQYPCFTPPIKYAASAWSRWFVTLDQQLCLNLILFSFVNIFLVWRWQRCTPFLPPAGQFSFFLLVKSQSPQRQWKKSFFAKTKWPKFSLWSADITSVTTAKLRKVYNNLWQNYGEAIYHIFFPVETVCIPNNIWRRRMCWCSRCKWQWRKQRRKRISIDERTNEAKPASKLRGT